MNKVLRFTANKYLAGAVPVSVVYHRYLVSVELFVLIVVSYGGIILHNFESLLLSFCRALLMLEVLSLLLLQQPDCLILLCGCPCYTCVGYGFVHAGVM